MNPGIMNVHGKELYEMDCVKTIIKHKMEVIL